MSSPTTPVASLKRIPFSQPWRPWSQPVDEVAVRRTMCGFLNKVSSATLEPLSSRFADLVVRVERSGDAALVEACAGLIVQRCVADPDALRIGLLAKMVQRAADEAEGEDLRWRNVDPYHLGNPAVSLQTTLKTAVLDECLHALTLSGREGDSLALAAFVGELLVLGVLSSGDVQELVGLLFLETGKSSDHHCIALCRILRRVVSSTEASSLIDGLSLVDLIEGILEEDTLSFRIRYMMMDMLDQCLYPRPHDAFSSDIQRSEVYGLRDDSDDDHDATGSPSIPLGSPEVPGQTTPARFLQETHKFLASRDINRAEVFCRSLHPSKRPLFLAAAISAALASGDESDAALVATLLSRPATRALLDSPAALARAFEPEILALEDTVLDVPAAYRLMAIMLSAAALAQHELEDLAARIVVRENAARERLLDEVAALSVSPVSDRAFRMGTVVEETSEDEEVPSDYAVAY
ncbi:hypothetical protein C8Q77DRAFT_1161681 [Trametes polyzona]|nr:hypothetical protein C8Q77DRAFT_1161681 [Trametes polyzona]